MSYDRRGDRQRELEALHRALFRDQPAIGNGVPEIVPSSTPPRDLWLRASRGRIRRSTLNLLNTVGADRYSSPSEADSAIAAGLCSAGLTPGEALTLILASPRGKAAVARKGRHTLDYWERTVGRAAGYVGEVVEGPGGLRIRMARDALSELRPREAGDALTELGIAPAEEVIRCPR